MVVGLKLPFEIIDEYISTPIKAIIARRLWKEGYTQIQISRLLGVTQPTVNIYIRSPLYDEETMLKRISSAGLDRKDFLSIIERVLTSIREGKKVDVMAILTEYILKSLSELKLCEAHRKLDPGIPLDCRICAELIQIPQGFNILRALENAYEYLSRERCIYILIPEVLMNIAYAKEYARGLEDVAAFPGRIIRVGKGIATVSKPSWGASKHLGKIILNVAQRRKHIRAIANIKVLKCVEQALKELGISYRILGPRERYINEDEIISEVSRSLSEEGIEAIVDLGGLGIEPITYIVGVDPVEVAKRITYIARTCAKEQGNKC
jgi:predicted fused transcriptional regulator/phosphomethylpyrimidine kinase/predicted transcriptional regulator